jgi:hypothetical protein
MAIYEMTLRFDAGNDHAAMSFGIGLEAEIKQAAKQAQMLRLNIRQVEIQRLTRIIVARMPIEIDWEPVTARSARKAGGR